jgi:hypothetical protein
MVRKQVYIEPGQERVLKQRARELGVSEAEMVRRGIEAIANRPALALGPDRVAWEEELAFMRERAEIVVPQTERQWTREELHDR